MVEIGMKQLSQLVNRKQTKSCSAVILSLPTGALVLMPKSMRHDILDVDDVSGTIWFLHNWHYISISLLNFQCWLVSYLVRTL